MTAREALGDPQALRLMTVPGVGVITACTFIATIGEIDRFPSARRLVGDLGLDPRVSQSGTTPARHGLISKQGSAAVRHVLVEAALIAARAPRPTARVPRTHPRPSRRPSCGGRYRARAPFGQDQAAAPRRADHVFHVVDGEAEVVGDVVDRVPGRSLVIVWHISCYGRAVGSRVVRARLDEASEQALAALTREGRNESEAVRTALVEAGRRRRRRAALADEVRRLEDDPADTAERTAVMADMEALASDWPE